MQVEELLAKLDANASSISKPIAVPIENVGVLYVRKRTIEEFELMAGIKEPTEDAAKSGATKTGALFASSVARLLCDEEGRRYPLDVQAKLLVLMEKQPEEVFHALIAAADGKRKFEEGEIKEGDVPNSPSASDKSTT